MEDAKTILEPISKFNITGSSVLEGGDPPFSTRANDVGGPMSKMRVVQVTRPNGLFEIVEREIPEPGAGQVRVKVETRVARTVVGGIV